MGLLIRVIGLQIFITLLSCYCFGQGTTYTILQDSLSAEELSEEIRGSGIGAIFNAKVGHCGPAQRGRFEAQDLPGFQVRKGIMLTNGTFKEREYIVGGADTLINIFAGLDTDNYEEYDVRLCSANLTYAEDTIISGMPYHNTLVKNALIDSLPDPLVLAGNDRFYAALEFDFVPLYDTVKFEFVGLGSGWHTGYCSRSVLEVWAAVIQGPGFENPYNALRIPGTTAPITNNTINNRMLHYYIADLPEGHPTLAEYDSLCRTHHPDAPFEEYYVQNLDRETHPYHTHTTVMSFSIKVNPCDTYRIHFNATPQLNCHSAFIIPSNSFRAEGNGVIGECAEDTTTSIKEYKFELEPWILYPNPTKNGFSIKFQGDYPVGHHFSAVFTDVLGNKLWTGEGKLSELNPLLLEYTQKLPNGYYYLELVDKNNLKRMVMPAVKIQ